jgi:flagellar basal body rod protein FlgC
MKKNKLFLIAQVFLIATSAMAGEPTRFELGSSNSWNCSNYSSTNKTIYSGSTIELNGVTVTIGNSEQKEQSLLARGRAVCCRDLRYIHCH